MEKSTPLRPLSKMASKSIENQLQAKWRKYRSTSDLSKPSDLASCFADPRASCDNLVSINTLSPTALGKIPIEKMQETRHSMSNLLPQRLAYNDARNKLESFFSRKQSDESLMTQQQSLPVMNTISYDTPQRALEKPETQNLKSMNMGHSPTLSVTTDQESVDPLLTSPPHQLQSHFSNERKMSSSTFSSEKNFPDTPGSHITKQTSPELLEARSDVSCNTEDFEKSQLDPQEDAESGVYLDTSNREPFQTQYGNEDVADYNREDQEEDLEDIMWRPYDLFGTTERDAEDDNRVFREIIKVIRCSLYVFICLVMLIGTVANRIAIFLMASGISQGKEARSRSTIHLIICMCAPVLYCWFQALMKILFGGKQWPSLWTFFTVLVVELISTTGMCFLVFLLIPSTDVFRGITVTFATFQIPVLFNMIMPEQRCSMKTSLKTAATALAALIQLGAPAYFLTMDFSTEKHGKILTWRNQSQEVALPDPHFWDLQWQIPVSLVLVSLTWWENYFPWDWSLGGCFHLPLKRWRQILQDTRHTSYFLTAPCKVGLVVVLGRYLADADFSLFLKQEDSKEAGFDMFVLYSLLCIVLGSAILCTYLGSLACKLHMQNAAFAIPLVLSSPISLAVVYLQCRYEFMPLHWQTGAWYCPNLDLENLIQPMSVAAALWISYCIIVSHIWFPQAERMAKTEKLFMTPHFTSVFPDFNLALRRRRDDKELLWTALGNFAYVGEEKNIFRKNFKAKVPQTTTKVQGTTPTVYVCATMWHETKQEMTQLLKSLFRLDYSHCASRLAGAKFNIKDPDYFEMEIHIIFDDAFELDDKNQRVPNGFVHRFIGSIEEAAKSVLKGFILIPSPVKVATPYGGRLVWTMPGQTQLVVHLKDKNKIRHRKRWSQVMYMYYLLGFRLLGSGTRNDAAEQDETPQDSSSPVLRNRTKSGLEKKQRKNLPFKQLLMRVSRLEYEQILDISENTFILTLDGDIDFKPESVKLLLDRMKKDKKVGAVCGRIHPIGSGPMVWYQQFEYAVSHWLQKAAEHVFGCVLCCPGCFSLFRASALMDDNVMKMYTMKPTEASHFIQFEQGEDRWLCTLLLQQGHRIDYCAGADALTFAPETFNEFFNQRRRWSPSTLANMMDLLGSWRLTVRLNDNISRLYILYQFTTLAASILAPSTVLLMITDSYHTVLGFSLMWSYLGAVLPVIFYIVVCLTQKTNIQIKVGAVLSAFYTVVMMVATVATVISIATEEYSSPNTVFISSLVTVFVISAFLHPQEFHCLLFGVIYFLVIPTTFILLTVFYLCNLNNVSWGTREIAEEITAEKQAEIDAQKAKKKKSWNILSASGLRNIVEEIRELVKTVWGLKKGLEEQQSHCSDTPNKAGLYSNTTDEIGSAPASTKKQQADASVPEPDTPHWLYLSTVGDGPVDVLDQSERKFWAFLLKKYLHPLDENKEAKEKIARDLKDTRNNVVFVYILLNLLWTVIALQLQAAEDQLKDVYIAKKYEPMSVMFLATFAIVIAVQFVGMFIHRWGTFLHLMSSTHIDWFFGSNSDEDFARLVVQEIQKHQNLEPLPDYEREDEDEEDTYEPASFPTGLSHLSNDVDDDLYSQTRSETSAYRGLHGSYNRWPEQWNIRQTNTGHFPQLENIFDHHLDRLKQQVSRAAAQSRSRGGTRRSRRSLLGSLRGPGDACVWPGETSSSTGRQQPQSGWSSRNLAIGKRFPPLSDHEQQCCDNYNEMFQGVKVI